MKVISILQPWATLIVIGAKKIETRSWNTKYRGEILIHASKKFTKEQDRLAFEFSQELKDSRIYHCHRGSIIGKANLVDTNHTDLINIFGLYDTDGINVNVTDKERMFGNYGHDRYGWLLSDPVLLDYPITAKGNLSLWNFEPTDDELKIINPPSGSIICPICIEKHNPDYDGKHICER